MGNDLVVSERLPVIIPIISPAVHWESLLRDIYTYTGESLTRALDIHEIKPKTDQSIVAALSQFVRFGYIDPYKEMREAGLVLRHLSFSFFCVYSSLSLIDISISTEITSIAHHSNPDSWILGGNLLQWKLAIIEICQSERNRYSRLFMNMMLAIFEMNGYSMIWDSYQKVKLPDGTFSLELKHV